ncbi:Cna B-type domain-containing protein [Stecheria intestinalis]|nr:Cna B-type domain-containing protein [Stecheria intestinalis]
MKISEKLRIVLTVFCAVMLMSASPLRVFAEGIVPKNDCSITLKPGEGINIDGAEFRAYRFADVSGNGEVSLLSEYYQSSVDIGLYDGNEEHMAKLASTLVSYVSSDQKLSYERRQVLNGKLEFTGLTEGLYLIVGEPYSNDHGSFKASPMILSVPNRDEGKAWNYDVSGEIKGTFTPKTDTKTNITVSKLWAGDGNGSTRPVSIEVQLTHDLKPYGETVVLNADNNWSYTWKDLSSEGDWNVAEVNVPAGYTTSVSKSGTKISITNTYHNETPTPSPTPTPTATPTPTPTAPSNTPTPTPTVTPTPTPTVPANTPTPTPHTPTAPPTRNTPSPTPFTPITRTPFTPMTSARRPYTPYTSDNWNMGLWISLLAGAGAVMIYAGTRLRNDQ